MKNPRIAWCALILFTTACFADRVGLRRENASTDSIFLDVPEAETRSSKSARKRDRPSSTKASAAPIEPPAKEALNDSVGPLPAAGSDFTVLMQKERFGTRDHVRYLQIRDASGAIRYQERLDPPMRENDPAWTVTVRAHALRSDRGHGLILYYRQQPGSARSGTSVRILESTASGLVPIAPRMTVHGRFLPLQEGRERDAWFLLPGDRLEIEVWQGHFGIVVPYQVRLGSCARTGQSCMREAIRRGDIVPGLSILPVEATPSALTADTSVMLYDAPEGKVAISVPVLATARIAILDAAAEVFYETEDDVRVVRTRREWLRVRINNREGWIHGAESLGAIGLPPT